MKRLLLIFCVCLLNLLPSLNESHGRIDEAMLRKRIQELQQYRQKGLTTAHDIEKFEQDCYKRVSPYISAREILQTLVSNRIKRKQISHENTTSLTGFTCGLLVVVHLLGQILGEITILRAIQKVGRATTGSRRLSHLH
jgi:hypothetical protein